MDAPGTNHDPKRRRDVCVESDALSYYTAKKSKVESFMSDLVKNKSSLIVCKEALAALPVTIRDNTMKQLLKEN